MCDICHSNMDRRRFFGVIGAGLAGLAAPSLAFAAGGPTTHVSADEALAKLKSGNERYLASPKVCAADLAKAREAGAQTQTPWATVITCSDSRVPPELLFGGLGVG